jgi:RNA-binding protein
VKKLTNQELRTLRGRGHQLKPVVLVGHEGITDAVLDAVDEALRVHELVKVKLLQSCEVDKDDAAQILSEKLKARLIQRVGRTSLLWRENPKEDKNNPGRNAQGKPIKS